MNSGLRWQVPGLRKDQGQTIFSVTVFLTPETCHLPPETDAAYAHLRSRAENVNEPKVVPYGMKQLYVRDPDGYNLCFQWPAA